MHQASRRAARDGSRVVTPDLLCRLLDAPSFPHAAASMKTFILALVLIGAQSALARQVASGDR